MKNLNKKTEFEKRWEDAFRDAEMAPSEGIWDKIDSTLSKEEAGYFKKRAFLFKLLAAASIAFALGVGIFSVNYYLGQGSLELVVEDKTGNANNSIKGISSTDANSTLSGSTKEKSVEQRNTGTINKDEDSRIGQDSNLVLADNGSLERGGNSQDVISFGSGNFDNTTQITNNEDQDSQQFISLSGLESQGIFVNSKADMVYEIDHIYLIPMMPKGASKKKKKNDYGVFLAGLDFSTGVFDPNFQQGNNVFASSAGSTFADARVESVNNQLASFNTTNKDFLLVRSTGQETKPEVAYSYGANVGFRISKRFVVQTGLAYRKANTTTTTTGYIENAEQDSQIPIVAAYQYQLGGLSSVKRIPETNLNNQYEFASIPIRAGYVFLDKKLNMALMAGISSEFFLNNQIGSSSNELETLSTSGNSSPYRSVYFNGSLGTMVGYTFAKNYLISVEPSYRFAVNSFTKDDFYLNSYPSSFMVSFGIAYNFK